MAVWLTQNVLAHGATYRRIAEIPNAVRLSARRFTPLLIPFEPRAPPPLLMRRKLEDGA
jgi:hypothetical protein